MELFYQELTYIFNAFVAIFVIVDPFAVIPVYMSLTQQLHNPKEHGHVRLKASLIALAWYLIIKIRFGSAQ